MAEQTRFVYNADGVEFIIYKAVKPAKSGTKVYWLLEDHSTGKRRTLNNTSRKAAERRADQIRSAMVKGQAHRLLLSNGQWQDTGNQAYYSTKARQQHPYQRQNPAQSENSLELFCKIIDEHYSSGNYKDDYDTYLKYGGELSASEWINEKKQNLLLSDQEVAVRMKALEFRGRNLTARDRALFVITQMNIWVNGYSPQYKVFATYNYDFLDNETLFELFIAFARELHKDNDSIEECIQNALGYALGGMRDIHSLSIERMEEFGSFFKEHVQKNPIKLV